MGHALTILCLVNQVQRSRSESRGERAIIAKFESEVRIFAVRQLRHTEISAYMATLSYREAQRKTRNQMDAICSTRNGMPFEHR